MITHLIVTSCHTFPTPKKGSIFYSDPIPAAEFLAPDPVKAAKAWGSFVSLFSGFSTFLWPRTTISRACSSWPWWPRVVSRGNGGRFGVWQWTGITSPSRLNSLFWLFVHPFLFRLYAHIDSVFWRSTSGDRASSRSRLSNRFTSSITYALGSVDQIKTGAGAAPLYSPMPGFDPFAHQ